MIATTVDKSSFGIDWWHTITLQSTITLLLGDKIWLTTALLSQNGILVGGSQLLTTYFSGFLLEEEISL